MFSERRFCRSLAGPLVVAAGDGHFKGSLGGLPTAHIDELDSGVLKKAGQIIEVKVVTPARRKLALEPKRFRMLDHLTAELNGLMALAMNQHHDTVTGVAEVSGRGVDSAQQLIIEVGLRASAPRSPAELTLPGGNLSRKGKE